MESIILIPLVSFMLFTLYVLGIAGKYKTRKSISDSDYWLTYPWKWLFEAIIGLSSLSIMYVGLGLNSKMLFVGGGLIMLVPIFSRFKKNLFFKIMHLLGAIVGLALCTLSFWIDFAVWWITVISTVSLILTFALSTKDENVTWNIEISLIYWLFFGIIFITLKSIF